MKHKETQRNNHPKKGSKTIVDPIKSLDDIARIKKSLINKPRDLLLFTLGINNGLRVGDILKLKVGDVRYLEVGEPFYIIEQKLKTPNFVIINEEVFIILHKYINKKKSSDDDYLFKSRKGENAPLSVPAANRMMKEWTVGMKGNYGTHSLRKTFAYIQRKVYGVQLKIIQERFKHKSLSSTITYSGKEEIDEATVIKMMLRNNI